MAYEQAFADICAQVNSTLEPRQLLRIAGGHPDKLVKSGDVFLAHCPIHGEDLFRTLVLNPRNNTYHCRHVNCTGNKVADYLDLLAKVFQQDLAHVVSRLVNDFGADFFRLNDRQVEILGKKIEEAGQLADQSSTTEGTPGAATSTPNT